MPDASALALTLGGFPDRQATLDSATQGTTGSGNATAATLNGISFGGLAPWTERDQSTSSTNGGLFTVDLTSGSWGSGNASGTWTINDGSFWTTYGNVAISMHVGNGSRSNIHHFIWLIQQGQLTGTWSYTRGSTSGGGLSNLKLYTSGTGSRVPDSGATVALLGLSLLGLASVRKMLRK